jgi:hypothetical protein
VNCNATKHCDAQPCPSVDGEYCYLSSLSPIWNRDQWYKNRVFGMYLVCTSIYRYIPVCTLIYEISKYIPVCTEYVPEQSHAYLTQIWIFIQRWSTTAYMSRTHSIVSDSHMTQKSSLRNILVNMVHTGMYWYILSSFLDIPGDQHVLYMVNGAI